eukprot:1159593-Pelagomonas_calceolata.AAC.2
MHASRSGGPHQGHQNMFMGTWIACQQVAQTQHWHYFQAPHQRLMQGLFAGAAAFPIMTRT